MLLNGEGLLGVGWRTFLSFYLLPASTVSQPCLHTGVTKKFPRADLSRLHPSVRGGRVPRGGSCIWAPGGCYGGNTGSPARAGSPTPAPPGSPQQADGSPEGGTAVSQCSIKNGTLVFVSRHGLEKPIASELGIGKQMQRSYQCRLSSSCHTTSICDLFSDCDL